MKKRILIALPILFLVVCIIVLLIGTSITGEEKINITISDKLYKDKDYLRSFCKAFVRASIGGANDSSHFEARDLEFSVITGLISQFGIEDVDMGTTFPDKIPEVGLDVEYQGTVSLVCPNLGRHFRLSYRDLTHAAVIIRDAQNDEVLVVVIYDKPYFAGSGNWIRRASQKLQAMLQEG